MNDERPIRDLLLETSRDVRWICRTLERMEVRDADFEARLRELEGWRHARSGEERRKQGISAGIAAGAGGAVALFLRLLGGG